MKNERVLHERVALSEKHERQTRGIVGWFYRTYIEVAHEFLCEYPAALVLDIGCGEGVLLRGSGLSPIQVDISINRLRKADLANSLVCADGMRLPFPDTRFEAVLLAALLEHVSQPARVIEETWRILKPDGEVAILVPNDVWMSLGRLLLLKWPPRYPGHLSWITPQRIRRMTVGRFAARTALALPIKWLPFGLNMYYWVVLRKL